MSDGMQTISQLINATFRNIRVEDIENASELSSSWRKILLGIKSSNPHEGENLAGHSRIVDLKNGTLLVESDHPGWTSILQMHKKYILTCLQREFPELGIRNMVYRLSGSSVSLHGEPESGKKNATERLEKELDRQSEYMRSRMKEDGIPGKTGELPPELGDLFEDLRKNMLTKTGD